MKAIKFTILAALVISFIPAIAQGDTYSNPIDLNMDAVVRTYSTSASTGGNVICANSGNSPVTWFSFTTNAGAFCPLLNISASDNQPCEIALYVSNSGNMNSNMDAGSGMCFDDGHGFWAPSQTFVITANKTYYLRVKTTTSCTISIGGQHIDPPNDDCAGALTVSTTPVSDNNACHLPGPVVTPAQLCAFTLENTAFYQFYVASTGNSIINITSISCDNAGANNSNGFQIGFFTGNCSSLAPLSCSAGSGTFVQATTPILTAGTKVYVAIDGTSGSNCSYSIVGINVTGVLEQGIRNFAAWENGSSNTIGWTTYRNYSGATFYIQRSSDGVTFTTIGQLPARQAEGLEKQYRFDDNDPLPLAFYRLMIVTPDGKKEYSIIKETRRTQRDAIQVQFQNPVYHDLNLIIYANFTGSVKTTITGMNGQLIWQGSVFCREGVNNFSKDLGFLSDGKYFLDLRYNNTRITKSFLRLR